MRRLVLLTACLATLLTAGVSLAALVGQSTRPHFAGQILLDTTCPQPCWRGIRPGHTTVDQARNLLMADAPFIQHVTNNNASDVPGQPRVCWSMDVNPDWTGCAERDVVSDGPVNRIELHIPVETHFTLGEAILLFGKPQGAVICPQYGLQLAAIYFANGVAVNTHLDEEPDKLAFDPDMPVFLARFDALGPEPPYRFDVPHW